MFYLNNRRMALRTIHEKIKSEKWTTSEFAKYFETSEETFLGTLKKRTGTQYKDYVDGLEKNDKLAKIIVANGSGTKNASCNSPKAFYDEPKPLKEEAPIVGETAELSTTLPVADKKTSCESEQTDHELTLMLEIEEIQNKINALEEECNRIDSLIKQNDSEKEKIKAELEVYLEKVKAARERFAILDATGAALEQDHEKAFEEYTAMSDELQRKEEELESYKTVEVYFDQNGLHVSKEEYVPTKAAIGEKHLELSELEEYEFCSVRDIKAIAAISATVSMLKAAGEKYVIAYDKCPETISLMLTRNAA